MGFGIKKNKYIGRSQIWNSTELFYALVNNTNEAIIVIGEDRKIFLFNPAAEEIFEIESKDIISKPVDTLFPKEYRKKLRKYVKHYFSTGDLETSMKQISEFPGLRSNGEIFPMEISLSAGQSENRNFLIAITRDESQRKIVDKALLASDKRYHSLRENLPLGIYRSTLDGKILAVNSAFVSILGYDSYAEVYNLSSIDLYLDEQYRMEILDRLEKEGAVTNIEVQLLKKDGSPLWASLNVKAVKDVSGKIIHLDGIVADISERKQAEQALIKSEEKYRMLAETAQDIIIVHDLDGKILYTNQAGLKCLKYTREEIETKTVLDLVSPDNHAALFERQNRRMEGESDILLYNIDLVDSEDNSIPFEVSSSVFKEESQPVIVLIYARDLSARKKLEDQLHQSQKMDSIGTLAGGIAHDFNNLLTIINGLSESSLRRLENDHPIYRDLRSIHAAGKKAEDLTRKLLAFGRRQIIHPKIIDINLLISDLDKMLRRLIREDISIEKELYPQVLHIKADPGQIEQILINLVVNARDAISEDSDDNEKRIYISTRPVTIMESFLDNHPESQAGTFILMTVSDSGIGMDRAVMDKIFEPFFTTKEKEHGTGLGMATVYGIVKQNNGFININSAPGEGTKIDIYWPTVDDRLPDFDTFSEKMPDDEQLKGDDCILVVEDDKDVRYFTCYVLRNLGYTVLEAGSGLEALDIIKNNMSAKNTDEDIDLVITDLIMPGMNGKELGLKIEELSQAIKILYTSGYTEEYIYDKDFISGRQHFIQKPFTIRKLAKEVRNVIETS